MAAARAKAAALTLTGTILSLGAIGFVCGFAGLAHLTRVFVGARA